MNFYLNIKIFNQKLLNYVKIKRKKRCDKLFSGLLCLLFTMT